MSAEPVEHHETVDIIEKVEQVNGTKPQQPLESLPAALNYTEELNKIKDIASTYLFQQTQPIIIPTYSKWFDLDTIHQIEKEYFSDFFNENDYSYKNSRSYKDSRDFMVNTYRLHPLEYLTVTAVRRNLNMDIQSIIKIHQFLEKWGIINYQIDPRTRPSIVAPGYTGHFNVVLDTPRGLKMFVPENVEVKEEVEKGKYETKKDYKLSLQENKYSKSDDYLSNVLNKKDSISKVKHVCQTCGVDCVDIVYHNLRDKSNNICVGCFKEAKFLTIYSSSDFLKLNVNEEDLNENDWSSSEIFKLLEAIEMYENDWKKIAKYTNKTKDQCVLKFLTLPIEDEHFDRAVSEKNVEKTENSYDFEDFLQKVLTSLNDSDKSKIIENSNLLSQKYINETNVIIQSLTKNKVNTINLKLQKLDSLESRYTNLISEYESRLKKLALSEAKFEQKLKQVNDELTEKGLGEVITLKEKDNDIESEEVVSVEKVSEMNDVADVIMEESELNGISDDKTSNSAEKEIEYKIWAL
ncbi:hypothetical protein QEN19_002405 [Hanseniaspora menglaensis]